ncbi:hypothetical protein GXW82_10615 [Streptacidiphilus sp. 4-A2]|nr:hypothetical protein [Streptacidiphilus sp. 4-A2]
MLRTSTWDEAMRALMTPDPALAAADADRLTLAVQASLQTVAATARAGSCLLMWLGALDVSEKLTPEVVAWARIALDIPCWSFSMAALSMTPSHLDWALYDVAQICSLAYVLSKTLGALVNGWTMKDNPVLMRLLSLVEVLYGGAMLVLASLSIWRQTAEGCRREPTRWTGRSGWA